MALGMDKSTRLLLVCTTTLVVCCSVGAVAMMNEVYPGLRRPPPAKISGPSSNSYDENYLSQILSFIEEQARRKFQEKVKMNAIHPKPNNGEQQEEGDWDSGGRDGMEQDFTFKMPAKDVIPSIDEPFEFGVAPNDPRFYENSPARQQLVHQQHTENGASSVDGGGAGREASNEGPYMRINGPLNVNPDSIYRSKEMQGLLQKWGQSSAGGFDPRLMPGGGQDVVQRPIHLESSTINLYAVAMIAGVSAAITIGLIALGVGWWTFYKKSKAAQDVEYPAYGVTGPAKEKQLSPSAGDRRLAQNAQMYHYQHQKQQIIAMEKMNEDRNGSMSDVNSEDEEGDYTVYECPGLAPTGEMEVKNPLFFDDPTPATPGNNAAPSAKAQPKPVDEPAPSAPAPEKAEKKNHKK